MHASPLRKCNYVLYFPLAHDGQTRDTSLEGNQHGKQHTLFVSFLALTFDLACLTVPVQSCPEMNYK